MVSPNLDAFSDRNDMVFVIDRFNTIEEELSNLITKHINPSKENYSFVKTIILNNSIVSFSSKVKIFMHLKAINNWPKITHEKFHRFMHIRNQFAHCNNKPHIDIMLNESKTEKATLSVTLMLESLTNAGQIVAVDSAVALQEFTEIYIEIRDYIRQLLYNT